jgi:serine/threonine-protein kinase
VSCPDDSSVALLLEGRLGDERAGELRAHVETCERCRSVLDVLTATRAQVASAGGVVTTGPPQTPAVLASALARDPRWAPFPAEGEEAHRGRLVGGRYRLEALIGKGGMGVVWAAEHVVTRERVALKLLRAVHAERPDLRRRMIREARAMAAVRHPNVVHVNDLFEAEDGTPVLVMELLRGITLRERLKRSGRMELSEAARLLVPALSAIHVAHTAKVVHRDLKPDNLFLIALPDGRTEVRVLDFGLARFVAPEVPDSGVLTHTGDMLGTPAYMSLEQLYGEDDVDARSDVWAVGVILYECLTGFRPYEGEGHGQVLKRITTAERTPLGEVRPDLPGAVVALLDKLLTVERERRPADLTEAIAVLSPWALGAPIAPVSARRRSLRSLALGGALVVSAGAAALLLKLQSQTKIDAVAPAAPGPVAIRGAEQPTPPEPRAATPSPSRAVPPAAAQNVMLRFTLSPPVAKYQIWVDGRKLDRPSLEVARSDERPLAVKVIADGYKPVELHPLPTSDREVRVDLERRIPVAAPARATAERGAILKRPTESQPARSRVDHFDEP